MILNSDDDDDDDDDDDVDDDDDELLVWFDYLRANQKLWSCRDGKFTLPHVLPGQA